MLGGLIKEELKISVDVSGNPRENPFSYSIYGILAALAALNIGPPSHFSHKIKGILKKDVAKKCLLLNLFHRFIFIYSFFIKWIV